MKKPLTRRQRKLLEYFVHGRAESIPVQFAADRDWAKRHGLIENTGRTSGIASTIGGVQWLYKITEKGRALAQEKEGSA